MSHSFCFHTQNISFSSIQSFLNLTYQEYVQFLLNKYDKVKYDYFLTPTCKTKNPKISRVKEGLYCHHIDEDKTILLSTPEIAVRQPFSYQKANRLVYCTLLEHFLLHIKIAEERKDKNSFVGIGGATLITENINSLITNGCVFKWQIPTYDIIQEQYSDYIYVLGYFRNLLRTDTVYSHDLVLNDRFLCFDGKEFSYRIYNDLNNVLDWENYKTVIPQCKWYSPKLI